MEAIMEHTATKRMAADALEKPEDPRQEINSEMFLKALLDGPPADARAFRKLVQAMHSPLTRFLGRYLRDADGIQDALQETFLAVHRALPHFEGKAKLSTWVYSLAYHKICDRLSKKYRLGYEVPESGEGWELESEEPGVDELLQQTCLLQWIHAAAAEIPPLYREAYRLRDLQGLSGEDAADILGISAALIRVRLHRARTLIVEKIRRRYPSAFLAGRPI